MPEASGKVILWGLLYCHRDSSVNPLVPVGKSYPLFLDRTDEMAVQETLQIMFDKLGMKFGSVNVELVVDKKNRVYLIDVGPRAGGNMIPDLLGMIFGVDVVEMDVLAAMGEPLQITEEIEASGFYATHNLHSDRSGSYKQILFSDELKPYLKKICLYKKGGDPVGYFDNASKCLGIIFMEFPSKGIQYKILRDLDKMIDIQLR